MKVVNVNGATGKPCYCVFDESRGEYVRGSHYVNRPWVGKGVRYFWTLAAAEKFLKRLSGPEAG